MSSSPERAPAEATPALVPSGGEAAKGARIRVASSYFAEGFPYSVVNSGAQLLFKELGSSNQAVGLTTFFHLPWNLKFLWAPLVARVGNKRTLVVAQLACGALLALATSFAHIEHLRVLAVLFMVMAVASATNDIAIDGYYLSALDPSDEVRFVGLRNAAYRAANIAVKAGLPLLAGWLGFRYGLGCLALLLGALGVFHALFLRPVATAQKGERPDYLAGFRALGARPGIVGILAFVALFRTGESLLQVMKYPFLRDVHGLTLAEYGLANGTVGVIASVVATSVGAALIRRHGLATWFWPFILCQNLLHVLYVGLALLPDHAPLWLLTLVIAVEEFGAGLGTAVLTIFLMRACDAEHKTAHFAALTSLMSVSFTLAGALSGYLASWLGFPWFFVLSIVATFPMMALAEPMRRRC